MLISKLPVAWKKENRNFGMLVVVKCLVVADMRFN